jgi:hypothetical protein
MIGRLGASFQKADKLLTSLARGGGGSITAPGLRIPIHF